MSQLIQKSAEYSLLAASRECFSRDRDNVVQKMELGLLSNIFNVKRFRIWVDVKYGKQT